MCGIVGIFIKNPKLRNKLGVYLSAMIDNMSSRGPDSAGFAIYDSLKNKKLCKFSLCLSENTNSKIFIEDIKKEIPELPDKRKKRYIDEFKLSNYDSSILTAEKEISDFFDSVLFTHKKLRNSAKLVVNWITSELFSLLNKNEIKFSSDSKIACNK